MQPAEGPANLTYQNDLNLNSAEVELFPGGAAECVAFETREAYCNLLADYHLHEYDGQVRY